MAILTREASANAEKTPSSLLIDVRKVFKRFPVGGIFIGEGVMIGLISWLITLPLSIPLGILFSKLIANAIDFQFGYKYSPLGAVIWLVVVLVLSVISSGMPAWRASRVSVREVLSYE